MAELNTISASTPEDDDASPSLADATRRGRLLHPFGDTRTDLIPISASACEGDENEYDATLSRGDWRDAPKPDTSIA